MRHRRQSWQTACTPRPRRAIGLALVAVAIAGVAAGCGPSQGEIAPVGKPAPSAVGAEGGASQATGPHGDGGSVATGTASPASPSSEPSTPGAARRPPLGDRQGGSRPATCVAGGQPAAQCPPP